MKTMLQKLFGSKSPRALKPAGKFRPQMENLESRQLLTVSVGLNQVDPSILEIRGDGAGDRVEIRENHTATTNGIQVRYNYQANGSFSTRNYSTSAIRKIDVELNGGSDTFRYYLQSDFINDKAIDVDLGAGTQDLAYFHMSNSGNTNYTIRGEVEIDVNGGAGRDNVYLYLGSIVDPETDNDRDFDFWADLGSGNDVLSVQMYGDLGEDVDVRIEALGGDQADSMSVNANLDVDLADEADLDVDLRGGNGGDLLTFLYRGENDGCIDVTLNAGNTAGDTIDWRIIEDAGSDGDVDTDFMATIIRELP